MELLKKLIKECIICGDDFVANYHQAKCCSEECKKKNQLRIAREGKPKKPLVKKNCLVCGKEFETRVSGQIYCSNDCCLEFNLKRTNERNRKKRGLTFLEEKRKCKFCNKEFIWTSSRPKQIFCSRKCTKEEHKKRFKEMTKGIFIHNGKSTNYYKLRFEILKRDNFTCQYCGRNVNEEKIKLHIDHINPVKNGGLFVADNLTTSCEECNLGKGDVLLEKKALIEA